MMYLMNTTMMPNNEGSYVAKPIDAATAVTLMSDCEWVSAVGHGSTAQAMSLLLGQEVVENRQTITLEDGDSMLCLKLRTRLAEGKIISSLEEINEIGFDLVLIEYTR